MGLRQGPSYICPSCLFQAQFCKPRSPVLRRQFGLNVFQRKKSPPGSVPLELHAPSEWSKKAADIKAGRKESMLSVLDKRGFVNQIVGERDDLDRLLTDKRVGVYVGVDPTALSLHVGHLVPFMALYWIYCHGFPAFSVLGGATAKIGDPSGRTKARAAQTDSQQTMNTGKIYQQLEKLWMGAEKELTRNGMLEEHSSWRRELVNNSTWLKDVPIMEIMRVLLPGVRLGTLLGRESVKTRMKHKDGMSIAEFLYPVLQAWDFWHLYSNKGVQVQIGGSDQFGNILAGVNAINYIRKNHDDPELGHSDSGTSGEQARQEMPMGLTIPLLTTASGEKFGKTAGNAIWLDPDLTSPFDLYQFFLGTADDDVHRYLKLFTFESLEALDQLMKDHDIRRSKRLAQHALALNVLRLVHGDEVAQKTRSDHSRLFRSRSGDTTSLPHGGFRREGFGKTLGEFSDRQQHDASSDSPSTNITLPRSLIYNRSMAQVLFHAGLVSSRSEGDRLCRANGVYVGIKNDPERDRALKWRPVDEIDRGDAGVFVIDGNLLFLRAGKRRVKVVMITSDADFEERGLTAPGFNVGQDEKRENLK